MRVCACARGADNRENLSPSITSHLRLLNLKDLKSAG
jgi:hypothetical protein